MAEQKSTMRLVDAAALPVYDFAEDQRLPTHDFFPAFHRRWLNSRYRLTADLESRALFWDLLCICRDQTPVGTLPDDDVQLSALLNLDLRRWQAFRAREFGPLYGWERCRVGADVRLMHPVVMETIEQALALRDRHRAKSEAAARKKARDRLPEQMRAAGVPAALCADARFVDQLDAWLCAAVPPGSNRGTEWITRGWHVLKG